MTTRRHPQGIYSAPSSRSNKSKVTNVEPEMVTITRAEYDRLLNYKEKYFNVQELQGADLSNVIWEERS